jgi:hypothetical protein
MAGNADRRIVHFRVVMIRSLKEVTTTDNQQADNRNSSGERK